MFNIFGYTLIKGLATLSAGKVNTNAANSKKLMVFSQVFFAEISAILLYYASKRDREK